MRKIFGNVKQTSNVNSAAEKDLRGFTITVNGLPVTIENKIAEGGFSFVYVVRCNKTGRLYALKRQFVNEQRLLEACKREIEITKTLGGHANIVTYVASSLQPLADGVHEYLLLTNYYRNSVLQLMNERLAAGRTLTLTEIVKIFCDVCSAVARLHHCQTPVIHRDLKVENLLLDSDGVCVLCDFGSATTRVLSTQTHPYSLVEEEVSRFTTLSYRSPEMVDLYSGSQITTKADIWALGVMLYKLCFFALPFGESALAIQNSMFTFPNEPEHPAELLAIIVYMLTPDANRRPDIYQVASTIFKLSGRECPVKNLNNSEAPSIQFLLNLLNNHQNRSRGDPSTPSSQTAASQLNPKTTNLDNGQRMASDVPSSTTSVVPRQRPKVQPPVCSPAIPLVTAAADPVGPWKQNKKSASPADDDGVASSSQSLKENSGSIDLELKPANHVEGHLNLPRSEGNGHRRNVSDPSAIVAEGDRCSAFRPYHSQQQVSAKEEEQTNNPPSWNPFDLDDHSFGLHFDELPRRRGSASSTANVKSRESLVMMAEDADPFGSAPFTPPVQRLSVNSTDKLKSKTKKSRYEKLINSDETETTQGQGRRLRPKELEDVDSVGSASDLQARMQVSSTTDDDETSEQEGKDNEGQSGSGDHSSCEADGGDGGPDSQQLYMEPELQGRRPLLAEDEDDTTELTEAFEMNILSPGSTDTMVGCPTFGSPINSEMSFTGDVFLNAPFKSLLENENNQTISIVSRPVRRSKPNDLVHRHKISGASDGSKGSAFVNTSFQGDDAFRT